MRAIKTLTIKNWVGGFRTSPGLGPSMYEYQGGEVAAHQTAIELGGGTLW